MVPTAITTAAPTDNSWITITMRDKHAIVARKTQYDFCGHNCAVAHLMKENDKK